MTIKITEMLGFVIAVVILCFGLKFGELPSGRSIKTIRRNEEPFTYWILAGLLALVAMLLLISLIKRI